MNIAELPKLNARFGLARQVAFVVNSLDQAIEQLHREQGMGPFLVARNAKPLANARFRGEPSAEIILHLGFAYIGELQIELIELVSGEPSMYREALDNLKDSETGLEHIHHYAVCVDDFVGTYDYAMNNGYSAILDSGYPGLVQMSYIESNQDPHLILEVIEYNDLIRPYFDQIKQLVDRANPQQLIHEFSLNRLTPLSAVLRLGGKLLLNKLLRRVA